MKTIFFSFQGISPMHHATEAEIVAKRLAAGGEVYIVQCDACLSSCSLNATHNLVGCAMCAGRTMVTINRLGIPKDNVLRLDRSLFPASFDAPFPSNLQELIDLSFEGYNLGRGVASSVISILRDYDVDPQEKHRALIEQHLCNSIGVLRNLKAIFNVIEPEEVVFFNGRHTESFPIVEYCHKNNIDFICHERGGSIFLYQEYDNNLPHSIRLRRKQMNELWESIPAEERNIIADNWFQSKRKGSTTDDRSYIDKQQRGLLPPGFDEEKHNLVIFNSSEDEVQAILEWKTGLYDFQNEAIEQVLEAFDGQDDVHIYLRVHPNLAVVENRQLREVRSWEQPNFTRIEATDVIDTYGLCEAADVVLSFGSTIGVEATYWGTPSVLYGRSFYMGTAAVYEPQSFEELYAFLADRNLAPLAQENAYKYGLFVNRHGYPYEHQLIIGPKEVKIGGKPLGRFSVRAGLKLIAYIFQLPRWLRMHRLITGGPLRLSELTKLWSHLKPKA